MFFSYVTFFLIIRALLHTNITSFLHNSDNISICFQIYLLSNLFTIPSSFSRRNIFSSFSLWNWEHKNSRQPGASKRDMSNSTVDICISSASSAYYLYAYTGISSLMWYACTVKYEITFRPTYCITNYLTSRRRLFPELNKFCVKYGFSTCAKFRDGEAFKSICEPLCKQ